MTDERWISVGAEGEAAIAPDLAEVMLGVSASDRKLDKAQIDVNARTSAVLSRLRELGVGEPDLAARGVSVQPMYDPKDGRRIAGYHVGRRVTARVRDLERLGDVLDGVVAAGANEVHGVEMSALDTSAPEHEALRRAVAAAHAKAEAIAAAAGIGLGKLVRLEEEGGVPVQPFPRARMAMAMEAAGTPTEVVAGELTITRRIRAWFDVAE